MANTLRFFLMLAALIGLFIAIIAATVTAKTQFGIVFAAICGLIAFALGLLATKDEI